MELSNILQIIWPLILIQLAFQVYALFDLIVVKKKTTRNLSPLLWGLIIVLGEVLGAALYFLLGRSE